MWRERDTQEFVNSNPYKEERDGKLHLRRYVTGKFNPWERYGIPYGLDVDYIPKDVAITMLKDYYNSPSIGAHCRLFRASVAFFQKLAKFHNIKVIVNESIRYAQTR